MSLVFKLENVVRLTFLVSACLLLVFWSQVSHADITIEATSLATSGVDSGGFSISGPSHPDMTLTALLIFSAVYLTLIRFGTFRTLKCTLLLFLSTSVAAAPTMADVQTGLYLGIGGGASHLRPDTANVQLDDQNSMGATWNATAGYQVNRSIGVEMEYADMGTTSLNSSDFIDYQNVNISGIYHLGGAAVNHGKKKYSLYGRVGVGAIRNQSNIELERGNRAHWLAGAGVQVPLGDKLSLRAEGVNYAADASRAGLSLVYQTGKAKSPSLGSMVAKGANEIYNTLVGGKNKDAAVEIQTANHELEGSENTVSADSIDAKQAYELDKPLFLSADQHQPHTKKAQSLEQMMALEPAPKKRWLISQNELEAMHGKSSTENTTETASRMPTLQLSALATEPSLDAAMPQLELSSIEDTNEVSNAIPALQTSTTDAEPVVKAAMPQVKTTSVSDAAVQPVLFGFDRSTVGQRYKDNLKPLIAKLKNTPDASVTLTGYTDSIGTKQYNQQLSMQRAEAVRQFLLQQGIDRKMIRVFGAGEKRPVKSNAKPSGRKANRRVAIVVT